MMNLIEQIQDTAFFLHSKQQRSPSHNFYALRTTLSSKQTADDIHTGTQYSRLDKIYALKQLLSTRGQSSNFLLGGRYPNYLLPSTQLHANKLKLQLRVYGYPKNTQTIHFLKLSTTKSKLTITGITGPRPVNHHGFSLLKIQHHVPLQTPGVDYCQILIQRFHHLRTRKRSRKNCIYRSVIRIAHYMVSNNVEGLAGVQRK